MEIVKIQKMQVPGGLKTQKGSEIRKELEIQKEFRFGRIRCEKIQILEGSPQGTGEPPLSF